MGEFDKLHHQTEQVLIKKANALSNRKNRSFYLNAAILSVYGWQMAIPVLLGIILGQFLDHHFPNTILSWTLNFIIIGFVIGFINATYWIKKEGIIPKKKKAGDKK